MCIGHFSTTFLMIIELAFFSCEWKNSHRLTTPLQHLPFIKGKRVTNNVYGTFNSASLIPITPTKCQLCIMEVQYNTSVIYTIV